MSSVTGNMLNQSEKLPTSSNKAQSVTVRAIGPRWSHVISMGTPPVYGTSPHVGFRPTMPHHEDGMRIDPP